MALPSVDGALSLPAAAGSLDVALRFPGRMLHIVGQNPGPPKIAIGFRGRAGRMEVNFPAREPTVPPPPLFWGGSGNQVSGGAPLNVRRATYAAARSAQAVAIRDVVLGRRPLRYSGDTLVQPAGLFYAAAAASRSPNGYTRIVGGA